DIGDDEQRRDRPQEPPARRVARQTARSLVAPPRRCQRIASSSLRAIEASGAQRRYRIRDYRSLVSIDIRRTRQHNGALLRYVDLDRVRSATFELRLAHFELVMSDQRLLQSIDG